MRLMYCKGFLFFLMLIFISSSLSAIICNPNLPSGCPETPTVIISSGGGNTSSNFSGYHNDLLGLQGGQAGEYYHLNAIDYFNLIFLYNYTEIIDGDFVNINGDNMTGQLTIWNNLSVNGSILPDKTLTWDIGSGVSRWKNLFTQNISTEDISTFSLTALLNISAEYFVGSGAYLSNLNISGDLTGYTINASFLVGGGGGIDMRGEPWYFSGVNFEVANNISAMYFKGNGSRLTDVCLSNGTNCLIIGNFNYNQTIPANLYSDNLFSITQNNITDLNNSVYPWLYNQTAPVSYLVYNYSLLPYGNWTGNSTAIWATNGIAQVGIGTQTPMNILHVSDVTPTLEISQEGSVKGTNSSIEFSYSNIGLNISRIQSMLEMGGGGTLRFDTASGGEAPYETRMIILKDGSIGIGTTKPTVALNVTGSVGVSADLFGKSATGIGWNYTAYAYNQTYTDTNFIVRENNTYTNPSWLILSYNYNQTLPANAYTDALNASTTLRLTNINNSATAWATYLNTTAGAYVLIINTSATAWSSYLNTTAGAYSRGWINNTNLLLTKLTTTELFIGAFNITPYKYNQTLAGNPQFAYNHTIIYNNTMGNIIYNYSRVLGYGNWTGNSTAIWATNGIAQVGIGTTVPNAVLDVHGNVIINSTLSSGSFQVINTSGANHFLIDGTTGNIGIGTTPQSSYGVTLFGRGLLVLSNSAVGSFAVANTGGTPKFAVNGSNGNTYVYDQLVGGNGASTTDGMVFYSDGTNTATDTGTELCTLHEMSCSVAYTQISAAEFLVLQANLCSADSGNEFMAWCY